ncbi:MAG: tryptophan synthase subunit alpha [Candidatus Krumholzibacteria bacterium]|nr:tryptophan synthase subunit alpha [Candidatus Krumholzibacteria bacterium]
MTRLAAHSLRLRSHGRKALVAYLTAGYPDVETSLGLILAAAEAGCDAIEIGIPFSDPIADGPVIQAASTQALAGGMTVAGAMTLAARAAERTDVPLLFMSYVSPILAYGIDRFAEDAARAGVSGAIVPDVPHEESAEIRAALEARGLALIDLVAPTSSDPRLRAIGATARGFLYLVSLTGVTGARARLDADLSAFVSRVRAVTEVPLYVGFGISNAEQAAAAARAADGVIIGSRLLALAGAAEGGAAGDAARAGAADAAGRVAAFLAEVRAALDAPALADGTG